MLKARLSKDGTEVILLGLSFANLDRLRADALDGFIWIDGKAMGISCDIIITAGETEQEMMRTFAKFIGPETKVHIDDRFKS